MADQKKKTRVAGGGGQGEEPPEELAVPKASADEPVTPSSTTFAGQRVSVEGPPRGERDCAGQPPPPVRVEAVGPVKVSLQRSTANATADQAFWVAIRDRTKVIGFQWYENFVDRVLCQPVGPANDDAPNIQQRRKDLELLPKGQLYFGVDAYQLLKTATETFLILKSGVLGNPVTLLPEPNNRFPEIKSEEEARLGRSLTWENLRDELKLYIGTGNLPYINRVLESLRESAAPSGPAQDKPFWDKPFCDALVDIGPYYPLMIELLWSYWHEEGMLVQAINAVSLRFQNKRLPGESNPLANLELSPLRPLSNILWGYIQDEPFRLTVARRAYEYSHEYGLSLVGRAVPGMRPADHRSKFLEAFHSLLRQAAVFYKEDSDTTVIANGFPLLNSLKEVHMLLAEGAHNQFGDLPWTARVEMLIQQWLLSRRELREFLRGRQMVPYKESWMGQVDTLRRMFGWGDTPVTHFRDLGAFGEQILLSIRYGDWINVDNEDFAKNWARYWRPEIQGYIHAYRAVTGVDLSVADTTRQIDATPPAVLLQRRLVRQGAR
jgi:hypothetical protein